MEEEAETKPEIPVVGGIREIIHITADRGKGKIVDQIELPHKLGITEPAAISWQIALLCHHNPAERQKHIGRKTHLGAAHRFPYRHQTHSHKRVGVEPLVEHPRRGGGGGKPWCVDH